MLKFVKDRPSWAGGRSTNVSCHTRTIQCITRQSSTAALDCALGLRLAEVQTETTSNCTVTFSMGTWHLIKIRERKSPSRGVIQKCELHVRSSCDPKCEERTQHETLHQEQHARGVACDLAKSVYKLKKGQKLRSSHFQKFGHKRDHFIGNFFRCGVLGLPKYFLFAWAWILFAYYVHWKNAHSSGFFEESASITN